MRERLGTLVKLWQRLIIAVMMVAATVIVPTTAVFAADTASGSLQGFAADRAIDNGTIVRMKDGSTQTVEPAKQSDAQNMFGVTVDRQQVPIRLTNSDIENEVFVAVSGTYSVLVSSQNGWIEPGDFISLSSINGIGMKAGFEEPTVFGRASGAFNGSSASLGTMTIKDVDGRDNQTVALGSVPVTIEIQRNPNEKSTKTNVPEVLQRIGQAVAEKEVSPIRIYLSMAITAISLITAIIVIYSGVKNSIISIGRNPMSKKSIFRALLEIILTSLLILIIGLFAVYLLLRL